MYQTLSLLKFHDYLCRDSYQFISECVLFKLVHALFAFLHAFSKSSSCGSDHWEASCDPSLTPPYAFSPIHWHSVPYSNCIVQKLGIHPRSIHWASILCLPSFHDLWNWNGMGPAGICALWSSCVTMNYSQETIHWVSFLWSRMKEWQDL